MKFNSLIPELSVSNLEKSLEFYCGKLGFKIEYARPESKFAFLSFQGAQLMLEEKNADAASNKTKNLKRPFGRGVHFQIQVNGVDRLYAKLKNRKVKILTGLENRSYRKNKTHVNLRQFWVQDPDGFALRFAEFLEKNNQAR